MTNPIILIAQVAYDLHQQYDGAAVRVEVMPANGLKISIGIGWPDPDEDEDDEA